MTIPVYALYCSEFPEREAALRAHLKERNVDATYFRGYHGLTWGLDTTKEYDPGKRISPGHVGLNIGAWAMWQAAYLRPLPEFIEERADDPVIFFEDDVQLPKNFWDEIDKVFHDLIWEFSDWDLVFLGLAETEPGVWRKVTERIGDPDSRLCRLSNPFGTHALMVRRRAIPILLDKMCAAERNLDQQLWERVLKPGHLKWCAVLPTLVRQRTFDYTSVGRPEWNASTLRPEELAYANKGIALPTGRATEEVISGTLAHIDPFPCFYRGEPLDEHGTAPNGKSVPLYECARLNVVCHSRPNTPVPDTTPCESCTYRKEMAPSSTRERLSLPDGHFNPSIAMWQGKLIMASRDSWGHSKVALWELTNSDPDKWTGTWTPKPIGSYGSKHSRAPRLEDPRLFTARNPETGEWHLHSMFSLPDGYPPKVVRVGYVRFARDLSGIEHTEVLESPAGNLYEKNWRAIVSEGGREIRWGYAQKPQHIVLGAHQNWVTPNDFQWTGGVMRGGATPVGWTYPDGRQVYYDFFHGCLKNERQNVYSVGCCVFEANPPYRILRQTPTPIIWPDLPAADEDVVKRMVIWPGGAVAHAGAWFLSLGVDDTFCRIQRIPFEEVEAALDAGTTENRDTTSHRNTHIGYGIPARGV